MTVFKPNACLWQYQPAAVFTIKQLRWAIAGCEHALYVSQVFGAELKPVLPSFFLYPWFLFPAHNFFLSAESVSLPQKFAFSQTIPMPDLCCILPMYNTSWPSSHSDNSTNNVSLPKVWCQGQGCGSVANSLLLKPNAFIISKKVQIWKTECVLSSLSLAQSVRTYIFSECINFASCQVRVGDIEWGQW